MGKLFDDGSPFHLVDILRYFNNAAAVISTFSTVFPPPPDRFSSGTQRFSPSQILSRYRPGFVVIFPVFGSLDVQNCRCWVLEGNNNYQLESSGTEAIWCKTELQSDRYRPLVMDFLVSVTVRVNDLCLHLGLIAQRLPKGCKLNLWVLGLLPRRGFCVETFKKSCVFVCPFVRSSVRMFWGPFLDPKFPVSPLIAPF